MTGKKIHLIGTKGCGSVIAEAFLTLAELPYDREEIVYDEPGPGRDKLLKMNPLGQVPTLVLPDGKVLTESLAVAAYVHARNPEVGLVPSSPELQAKFWRWAVFLVAAIYPTFTYGDDPSKWVSGEAAGKELRAATDKRREAHWLQMETEAGAPYFLGDSFSAIDVYLKAMTHWRPRREWFSKNAPKLLAIADRVANDARLTKLWRLNFD